ncbi:MAG: hypothetical protein MZV70_05480 [Desulfobacterales bacterium]|nr:hypothetical protein [Desulfobacterales bacterium]
MEVAPAVRGQLTFVLCAVVAFCRVRALAFRPVHTARGRSPARPRGLDVDRRGRCLPGARPGRREAFPEAEYSFWVWAREDAPATLAIEKDEHFSAAPQKEERLDEGSRGAAPPRPKFAGRAQGHGLTSTAPAGHRRSVRDARGGRCRRSGRSPGRAPSIRRRRATRA